MLFTDFTYTPKPVAQNILIDLGIIVTVDGNQSVQQEHYQINPQHRDGNPNKAQWIVDNEIELSIFAGAIAVGAVETNNHYAWGLFLPDDVPEILGKAADGKDSRIARFDNGHHNGFWHGYPANIRKQEYPSPFIMGIWRSKNWVSKADIRKIISAQW